MVVYEKVKSNKIPQPSSFCCTMSLSIIVNRVILTGTYQLPTYLSPWEPMIRDDTRGKRLSEKIILTWLTWVLYVKYSTYYVTLAVQTMWPRLPKYLLIFTLGHGLPDFVSSGSRLGQVSWTIVGSNWAKYVQGRVLKSLYFSLSLVSCY